MIKYFVYDEESEISSVTFNTREEAEKELEENYMRYSLNAQIIEVDD